MNLDLTLSNISFNQDNFSPMFYNVLSVYIRESVHFPELAIETIRI
jgi:hypothetical protein